MVQVYEYKASEDDKSIQVVFLDNNFYKIVHNGPTKRICEPNGYDSHADDENKKKTHQAFESTFGTITGSTALIQPEIIDSLKREQQEVSRLRLELEQARKACDEMEKRHYELSSPRSGSSISVETTLREELSRSQQSLASTRLQLAKSTEECDKLTEAFKALKEENQRLKQQILSANKSVIATKEFSSTEEDESTSEDRGFKFTPAKRLAHQSDSSAETSSEEMGGTARTVAVARAAEESSSESTPSMDDKKGTELSLLKASKIRVPTSLTSKIPQGKQSVSIWKHGFLSAKWHAGFIELSLDVILLFNSHSAYPIATFDFANTIVTRYDRKGDLVLQLMKVGPIQEKSKGTVQMSRVRLGTPELRDLILALSKRSKTPPASASRDSQLQAGSETYSRSAESQSPHSPHQLPPSHQHSPQQHHQHPSEEYNKATMTTSSATNVFAGSSLKPHHDRDGSEESSFGKHIPRSQLTRTSEESESSSEEETPKGNSKSRRAVARKLRSSSSEEDSSSSGYKSSAKKPAAKRAFASSSSESWSSSSDQPKTARKIAVMTSSSSESES
jgi:hypothetical protein